MKSDNWKTRVLDIAVIICAWLTALSLVYLFFIKLKTLKH